MNKPVLGLLLLGASLLGGCDQMTAVQNAPQRVTALEKQVKGLETQMAQMRTAVPKGPQVEAGKATCTNEATAVPVKFRKAFAQPPTVVLGLSGFQADLQKGKAGALALTAEARDIKPDGFTVAVDAGKNKTITACSVTWVAMDAGPAS